MISPYIEQGYIQHADNVFQVIIWQITTTDHQIDTIETLANVRAIDKLDDYIT